VLQGHLPTAMLSRTVMLQLTRFQLAYSERREVIPLRYCNGSLTVTRLSLLRSAEREMCTSQSAVMLCDWGVRQVWLIPLVGR